MGIKISDPDYIEVPDDMARRRDGSGFIQCIKEDIDKKTQLALVIIYDPNMKHRIKACLDNEGIASQFIQSRTIDRAKITVYTNLLKQMNAKIQRDLYRI